MKAEAINTVDVDWQQRTLDELCSLRKELVEPSSTGVNRYVGLEHLDSGITQIRRWGNDADLRSTKSRFYPGDVLYGKLRPYLDKAAIAEWEGVCSTDILTLSSRTELADPSYLSFLLHTSAFINHAVATTSGVNHPRTSWASLSTFTHPVPPLSEQRAIATVLSKIQKAVEVQEKVVATLKELKAATMAKLFREGLRGELLKQTEIGEIPESWEVVPCEALCEMISVGIVVTPAKYYVPTGVPCFRSLNIREDRLVEDNLVFISQGANDLHAKSKLRAGDVIIVRSGYPGTACIVPEKYDGVNCIDLIIARPNRRRILSDYLSRYINSPAGKRQIMFGQGGLAQQHFNIGAMKRFLVALPSGDEQSAIAAVGSALDSRITTAETKFASLKASFSSMLHLLMTGQVRVNNLSG